MFERDYLMRLLSNLIQAMYRAMTVAVKEENPYAAARSIEVAIGNAVDMDASVFMSLAPASMASMMSISSMDDNGAEYIARSLALASVYNRAAGDAGLADLRMEQAKAVAQSFGITLNEMDFAPEATVEEATGVMEDFLSSSPMKDEAEN